MKWTQTDMRAIAMEEREALGLSSRERLDPYDLCREHGIPVYPVEDLPGVGEAAVHHFLTTGSRSWSAALIPLGSARVIVENSAHHEHRRRANIAHELGHHLLEHPFNEVLLGDSHAESFTANHEKQATFMAGELLVPQAAANRAAFDDWTNEDVSSHFGVSKQFAQMQMKGPRIFAQRARARQR